MQVDGGDQFCQNHALILAYIRKEDTTPTEAYINLLEFWNIHLKHIIKFFLKSKGNKEIIDTLLLTNKLEKELKETGEKYIELIDKLYKRNKNKLFLKLMEVMKTDVAKKYVPTWK